jgi:hypothetical protein
MGVIKIDISNGEEIHDKEGVVINKSFFTRN